MVKKLKLSLLQQGVQENLDRVLRGTLLAIDPSSGSQNSQPGYAIFQAGSFVDGGVIDLKVGSALNSRLFALGKTLREEFRCPDILVTEKIPPIGQNGFHANSMMSLQKSIGTVISSFECPLVEVAPNTWRKHIPTTYVKRDDNDALMMAYTVLVCAQELAGEPIMPLKKIERFLHG